MGYGSGGSTPPNPGQKSKQMIHLNNSCLTQLLCSRLRGLKLREASLFTGWGWQIRGGSKTEGGDRF